MQRGYRNLYLPTLRYETLWFTKKAKFIYEILWASTTAIATILTISRSDEPSCNT